MIRFLAKHPFWAFALLTVLEVILLLALLAPFNWFHPNSLTEEWLLYIAHTGIPGLLAIPFAAGVIMLRARSGLPLARLLWLPLLAAAQLISCMACVEVYSDIVLRNYSLWATLYLPFTNDLVEVSPGAYRNGYWSAGWLWLVFMGGAFLAALLGLLLGLLIARWKLRTGRWETIVPVEPPEKTP